jgi:hypothetical protein
MLEAGKAKQSRKNARETTPLEGVDSGNQFFFSSIQTNGKNNFIAQRKIFKSYSGFHFFLFMPNHDSKIIPRQFPGIGAG